MNFIMRNPVLVFLTRSDKGQPAQLQNLLICLKLYVPVNKFSVILGRLPGLTSTKQWGLSVLLKATTQRPG